MSASEPEVLLDEAIRHLEATLTAIRGLDNRIEALARFDAILVGLSAAGLSLWSQTGPGLFETSPVVLTMLAAGMLGLLASMVVAVWAYFAHEVAIGLHPSQLKDKLRSDEGAQALTQQLVEGYIRSVTANVVVLAKSTRRFRVALVLWIVSICLLAFAALGLIVTWTP